LLISEDEKKEVTYFFSKEFTLITFVLLIVYCDELICSQKFHSNEAEKIVGCEARKLICGISLPVLELSESGSECNSAMLTFDGVDLMGERLADEVIFFTFSYILQCLFSIINGFHFFFKFQNFNCMPFLPSMALICF
jgi:hypothetical protein